MARYKKNGARLSVTDKGRKVLKSANQKDGKATSEQIIGALSEQLPFDPILFTAIDNKMRLGKVYEQILEPIGRCEHAFDQARDALQSCTDKEFGGKYGYTSRRHELVGLLKIVLDSHEERAQALRERQWQMVGHPGKGIEMGAEIKQTAEQINAVFDRYRDVTSKETDLYMTLDVLFGHVNEQYNKLFDKFLGPSREAIINGRQILNKFYEKLEGRNAKINELERQIKERIDEANSSESLPELVAARKKKEGLGKNLERIEKARKRALGPIEKVATQFGHAAGKYDYRVLHGKPLLEMISPTNLIYENLDEFVEKVGDLRARVLVNKNLDEYIGMVKEQGRKGLEESVERYRLAGKKSFVAVDIADKREIERIVRSVEIVCGRDWKGMVKKIFEQEIPGIDRHKLRIELLLDQANREVFSLEISARKARTDAVRIQSEIKEMKDTIRSVEAEMKRYLKEKFSFEPESLESMILELMPAGILKMQER
ncbi:MAG: hypothetical protein KGH61_03745 [Candidatus Micrarchaeota archaeon]|nr:hypothetical protein [Candidatus Micrarchaeota archaeon]MDE1848034.1 hypothetical protein [Candidatus Micrarchaeota archaeon]MDE1864735.1 hypothetical protein [Candidatus Micrarchaeota archaeon]